MNRNALEFQNVGKKYDDFLALSDISFSVKKGEFFALLGQNGAGKTTLIGCLAGLLRRSSGEILVHKHDPEIDFEWTRCHLGIVAQEICFDPFFTPMEILRLQRGFFGLPPNEEYLLWLLDKLSLRDKKDTRGRRLSGGMKRRLMIAKALVHEPEILILDEPTAGVDVELRQNLWKFLQELRRDKNITILLTTHYLEEAEVLSDRVAIMRDGKIVLCENTKSLLGDQKRTITIEFFDGQKKVCSVSPKENIAEHFQNLKNVANIHISEPKLEDIFLQTLQK